MAENRPAHPHSDFCQEMQREAVETMRARVRTSYLKTAFVSWRTYVIEKVSNDDSALLRLSDTKSSGQEAQIPHSGSTRALSEPSRSARLPDLASSRTYRSGMPPTLLDHWSPATHRKRSAPRRLAMGPAKECLQRYLRRSIGHGATGYVSVSPMPTPH
jgi:hypothetical protein